MTYEFVSDNGTSLASIAGWGRTDNGKLSQHLLYANMSIVDVEQCKKMNTRLGYLITSQQICAIQTDNATRPTDACLGDSGGPLIQYYNNYQDFIQTGITSFGDGCAKPGIPGAYARVDQFIDWINEVINNDNDELEESQNILVVPGVKRILGGVVPDKTKWKFMVIKVELIFS